MINEGVVIVRNEGVIIGADISSFFSAFGGSSLLSYRIIPQHIAIYPYPNEMIFTSLPQFGHLTVAMLRL